MNACCCCCCCCWDQAPPPSVSSSGVSWAAVVAVAANLVVARTFHWRHSLSVSFSGISWAAVVVVVSPVVAAHHTVVASHTVVAVAAHPVVVTLSDQHHPFSVSFCHSEIVKVAVVNSVVASPAAHCCCWVVAAPAATAQPSHPRDPSEPV